MIITALMLDDDDMWINDVKIAIEGLPESFFKLIKTKITKIKILKITDPNKIIEEIQKYNPDIFLIDIELGSSQRGHEIYEDLFIKDIHIPSIAVSAVVTTDEFEKEIKEKGISSIVHKLKGDDSIEKRIAKEICNVVDSPENKFDQVVAAIERYQIGDRKINVNGTIKTISKCIQELIINPEFYKNRKDIFNVINSEISKEVD